MRGCRLDRRRRLCSDLSMSRRFFAVAACALLALVACRSASATRPAPIVVASDLDNAPFAYVDGAGQPAGRDVEMMRELARRLERELVWKRMPFDELLPAAERGEVDVVCATLGITPERRERVAFTRPYYRTWIALVERADRPLADPIPVGARLSGGVGTTAERAIRMLVPQAEFVPIGKDDPTALEQLEAGKLDAIAMDLPAAVARIAAFGGRLQRRAKVLCAEDYALALPKDRTALREQLDHALALMEAERWHNKPGRDALY
jgi:polar amino acid transport system substrate-binding protein